MNKTKILIVEDEIIVALDIKNSVKKFGYEVTNIASNYNDAIRSILENEPDIILMDINLENSEDGIKTVEDIYKIKYIPVVYLSAFCDDETIKRAIQTNPLAYLIKPFNRAEINSTIRLGLFKINKKKEEMIINNCMNFGLNYYFDINSSSLFYKTVPIKLSIKESLLLKLLIEAKGNIVTFVELESLIWPDGTMSKSSLRTLIYRLRTKLEFKLIETIQTYGCRLIVID